MRLDKFNARVMTAKFSAKRSSVLWHFLLLGACQTSLLADTRVLIIAGKGGAPEYTEKFNNYAQRLQSALATHYNFTPEQITILSESNSASSSGERLCNAKNVEQVFSELAASVKREDQFVVILFGHGSAEGAVSKFNLAGPDLRDLDFARFLERVPAERQVFINTSAASAGFIEKLARKDRVIITATRSPEENFATKFPEYWTEAFEKSAEVDLNKDRQISLLEAFDYARDRVVQFYEQANRLRPEHALLDDNGDGAGSETPAAQAGAVPANGDPVQNNDGALAAQTFLTAVAPAVSTAAPAAIAVDHPLEKKKTRLLAEIEDLKTKKSTMPVAEYERQLETLFIELAKLNREIKKVPH
ncbi:MAG: C13 family peptidase [bacterium]